MLEEGLSVHSVVIARPACVKELGELLRVLCESVLYVKSGTVCWRGCALQGTHSKQPVLGETLLSAQLTLQA